MLNHFPSLLPSCCPACYTQCDPGPRSLQVSLPLLRGHYCEWYCTGLSCRFLILYIIGENLYTCCNCHSLTEAPFLFACPALSARMGVAFRVDSPLLRTVSAHMSGSWAGAELCLGTGSCGKAGFGHVGFGRMEGPCETDQPTGLSTKKVIWSSL